MVAQLINNAMEKLRQKTSPPYLLLISQGFSCRDSVNRKTNRSLGTRLLEQDVKLVFPKEQGLLKA
jgi:hypothetical protein